MWRVLLYTYLINAILSLQLNIQDGWRIMTEENITNPKGAIISSDGFDVTSWYSTVVPA